MTKFGGQLMVTAPLSNYTGLSDVDHLIFRRRIGIYL